MQMTERDVATDAAERWREEVAPLLVRSAMRAALSLAFALVIVQS